MHACSTITLFLVTRHVSRYEHEKLCGSQPVYVIVRWGWAKCLMCLGEFADLRGYFISTFDQEVPDSSHSSTMTFPSLLMMDHL